MLNYFLWCSSINSNISSISSNKGSEPIHPATIHNPISYCHLCSCTCGNANNPVFWKVAYTDKIRNKFSLIHSGKETYWHLWTQAFNASWQSMSFDAGRLVCWEATVDKNQRHIITPQNVRQGKFIVAEGQQLNGVRITHFFSLSLCKVWKQSLPFFSTPSQSPI